MLFVKPDLLFMEKLNRWCGKNCIAFGLTVRKQPKAKRTRIFREG
jgi:hypothetical protein